MKRRKALLVLGMHRSGTSALTRVVNLLGAALARELIPANADNATGFWESAELNDIHEEVLGSLLSPWHDVKAVPAAWYSRDTARPFRERIANLLAKDFGTEPLFVVKDPRICLLMPLWLDVLREIGADAACVMPVRNPLEVAGSLGKRDGLSTARSLLLWLRYFSAAERDTRHVPRAFVHYEDLLRDWRGTVDLISRRLDIAWPNDPTIVAADVAAFLSGDHRHNSASDDELWQRPDVPDWVKTTYRWAEAASRGRRTTADLDTVVEQYRAASAAFAPLLEEDSLSLARHWYRDGWAPPRLRLSTVRGGDALRLRGRLPADFPALDGQELRVAISGMPSVTHRVPVGAFELRLAVPKDAVRVNLDITATRWLVPQTDLADSPDARRLAYLIDELDWESR